MLLAIGLEGELGKLFFDEVDDIGLARVSTRGPFQGRPTRAAPYQVEHAGRVRLVLGTLGEEEKTLARLRCVGDVVVREAGLFGSEVFGQGLVVDGLLAVPEELLGEAEAPFDDPSALESQRTCMREAYLSMPWPLYPKTASLAGAASAALALSSC
jgi:hypothetical protein